MFVTDKQGNNTSSVAKGDRKCMYDKCCGAAVLYIHSDWVWKSIFCKTQASPFGNRSTLGLFTSWRPLWVPLNIHQMNQQNVGTLCQNITFLESKKIGTKLHSPRPTAKKNFFSLQVLVLVLFIKREYGLGQNGHFAVENGTYRHTHTHTQLFFNFFF